MRQGEGLDIGQNKAKNGIVDELKRMIDYGNNLEKAYVGALKNNNRSGDEYIENIYIDHITNYGRALQVALYSFRTKNIPEDLLNAIFLPRYPLKEYFEEKSQYWR